MSRSLRKKGGLYAALCGALFGAQALALFASWLLSALVGESRVHGLLSGEGIRWFFAHFSEIIGGRPLVWLLFVAIAAGCARESGVGPALRHPRRLMLRERSALSVAAFFGLLYAALLLALTLPRRAVLAGVDGGLWPSPFAGSAVPAVAFGVCLFSVVYGVVAGRLPSLRAVVRSLHCGIAWAAPWLLLYVLAAQLWASVGYVF